MGMRQCMGMYICEAVHAWECIICEAVHGNVYNYVRQCMGMYMCQSQVENEHYSTVRELIRLVIIISRMLYCNHSRFSVSLYG